MRPPSMGCLVRCATMSGSAFGTCSAARRRVPTLPTYRAPTGRRSGTSWRPPSRTCPLLGRRPLELRRLMPAGTDGCNLGGRHQPDVPASGGGRPSLARRVGVASPSLQKHLAQRLVLTLDEL